ESTGSDMLIRVGYELIYECPRPTPMILTLSIHYTRGSDAVTRSSCHHTVNPGPRVSRFFRQLVLPNRRAAGPTAAVHGRAGQRFRSARRGRAIGTPAPRRG